MGDRTVRAVPRTDVPEDHERRSPVLPALTYVWAPGLFADGMQVQLPHQTLEPQILRTPRCPHLEPRGFALRKWLNAVPTDYLI